MARKAAALKSVRARTGLPGAGAGAARAGGGGGGGAGGTGGGSGARRTATGAAATWRSRSAFFRASLMRLMRVGVRERLRQRRGE
jgi:hypothetical protein